MSKLDHDFALSQRKATNISLRADMVGEAKRLGINLSRACEAGLASEIARANARRWQIENADALASSNEWVEANGLPLARHRQF